MRLGCGMDWVPRGSQLEGGTSGTGMKSPHGSWGSLLSIRDVDEMACEWPATVPRLAQACIKEYH